MKNIVYKFLATVVLVLGMTSCEDVLDTEIYSELNPGQSSNEITLSLLYNAYAAQRLPFFNGGIMRYYASAMTSGEGWNEGGAIASRLNQFRSFTWASNHGDVGAAWTISYQGIRDANLLLDNVNDDTEFNKQVRAEAKFIRGVLYSFLLDWFGEVPLRTSSLDDPYDGRGTEEEIKAQIEKDLLEASQVLPVEPAEIGRATKGAAYGVLTKFYLNTKQWQKAADMAKTIMDMGKYGLVSNYKDVFAIANEGNKEMIFVLHRTATGASGNDGGGEYINAITFPTDYPLAPNQQVYAAQTYFYDDFIDSFEEGDSRQDLFVKEYINRNGQLKQLYGNDKTLSLKFEFDPNAVGPAGGNDQPEVRYSDILLSRAEALNELQGPNQESIDLINAVKGRAGATLLDLNDFSSKDQLRAAILQEREWEFYAEAKGRQDQIRHGVFISRAQARGILAEPHHLKFPIPLSEINANSSLTQTDGY